MNEPKLKINVALSDNGTFNDSKLTRDAQFGNELMARLAKRFEPVKHLEMTIEVGIHGHSIDWIAYWPWQHIPADSVENDVRYVVNELRQERSKQLFKV